MRFLHIAGLTSAPDPAAFTPANVAGTASVIEVAKAAKVKRLVFVSSLAARSPDLSAYGASKAEAERLVEASGLDWTIVRPPGVYGPRDVDYFEMFRTAKLGFIPLPPARGQFDHPCERSGAAAARSDRRIRPRWCGNGCSSPTTSARGDGRTTSLPR